MSRVSTYIVVVSALAAVAAGALFAVDPRFDPTLAEAAFYFATLGFLGYVLSYSSGQAVGGSSAFLPFLAAAVLAPTWVGALAVSLAVLSSGLVLRGAGIKTIFNVAQVTLATALAILVYRILGGEPLITSAKNIPAYVGMVLTFASVNA